MKQFFLWLSVLFCLVVSIPVFAQTCCSQDAGWVAMVSQQEFAQAHLPPAPLAFTAQSTASMITFNTQDSKEGRAYYVPSDQPTTRVLLLFHEWWGLNDYIRREAEEWGKMLGNVDVYAVDLYDGSVATTREEAGRLSKALDPKRAETIISGLLAKAGKDKEIATLGWCMGGSWAFTAGVMADKQTRAVVMYYGFPEKESKRIKPLQSDVLYIWASNDKFITKDVVTAFQQNVNATGNKLVWHTFDADHAFANPSNPKYDQRATEEARNITLSFLKEKLRIE